MSEARTKLVGGLYAIDALLGTGGMGVVYAATHWLTGKRVAIKVLRPEHLNEVEPKRRFIREARAAADLNHPNFITFV
jgi:eukaryotic-like serine/threonine-protein kinase